MCAASITDLISKHGRQEVQHDAVLTRKLLTQRPAGAHTNI